MRLAIALLAAVLAGCSSLAPREPELRVVEVSVPVAVPCSTSVPPEKSWAMDAVAPDADVDVLMKAALAELEQRRGYEKELKASIEGCLNPRRSP